MARGKMDHREWRCVLFLSFYFACMKVLRSLILSHASIHSGLSEIFKSVAAVQVF